MEIIYYVIALVFSVMAHEVAHGLVADRLGDPTARLANRLNFNPVNHIDPFGSVLLPALMYLMTAPLGQPIVFGWAKPVPYNPYNLKNPKVGAGLIAVAGPLTNIFLAVIFGLILRAATIPGLVALAQLSIIVVLLNIVLAVFNLVPIPPLDGSKVLFSILPASFSNLRIWLEQYGFILLLFFIFFGFSIIMPVIDFLFYLIVGNSLPAQAGLYST
ncbi:MAG: site-2 protease family protein [Candidatus Liptonbacteria bacterium]|nr:site-2 protease family protein [Candidatus Liptonbacteria bacterium]